MGDSTMAVLALYREGGFHVDEAFAEMPDHVAVELEFLYLLSTRLGDGQVESSERDRLAALERSLLDEHLGRWIVPFTVAMQEGTGTDFYGKLADLTRRFHPGVTIPASSSRFYRECFGCGVTWM